MRARWYDAQQGRFVSEDPIGLAGGINPYRFAGNDPVNKRDPTGLEEECTDWYTVTINVKTGVIVKERYLYTTCTPSGGGGSGGGKTNAQNKDENKQCPIPPALPGVANLDKNIRIARAVGGYLNAVNPLGFVATLHWFKEMVDYDKPWDFKNHGGVHNPAYENGGNFHYGATGAAAGIPSWLLRRAAGWAQRGSEVGSAPDEGVPWGRWPHGDQRVDQAWIDEGIRYLKEGCEQ